jgi:uroporphyrinogen-III synthase
MSVQTAPDFIKERLTKVKSILISQPAPTDEKSPYFQLRDNYGLKIDFKPFIKVDVVDQREFRKQKIDILAFSAIIFTSKNAVDHFFAICKELKLEMPPDMKYFCVTEQTANYLQKYIVIRKRKIFYGQKTASDLFDVFKKHKTEKYLYPCSDIRKDDIPEHLRANGYDFAEAIIYKTMPEDLSSIKQLDYDIIAFFSPSGVSSLLTNFPEFKQNGIRIAAFGPSTSKAVKDAGLILDIEAPLPNAPSMTGALELYVKKANHIK